MAFSSLILLRFGGALLMLAWLALAALPEQPAPVPSTATPAIAWQQAQVVWSAWSAGVGH